MSSTTTSITTSRVNPHMAPTTHASSHKQHGLLLLYGCNQHASCRYSTSFPADLYGHLAGLVASRPFPTAVDMSCAALGPAGTELGRRCERGAGKHEDVDTCIVFAMSYVVVHGMHSAACLAAVDISCATLGPAGTELKRRWRRWVVVLSLHLGFVCLVLCAWWGGSSSSSGSRALGLHG